jgi:hypothetical protein
MQIFRATQLVFVLTLCLIPASAEKKPKPPLEKTYETSVDKAYVAMVRAAGSNLVSEVKEACLVNFKFGQNWKWILHPGQCCRDMQRCWQRTGHNHFRPSNATQHAPSRRLRRQESRYSMGEHRPRIESGVRSSTNRRRPSKVTRK